MQENNLFFAFFKRIIPLDVFSVQLNDVCVGVETAEGSSPECETLISLNNNFRYFLHLIQSHIRVQCFQVSLDKAPSPSFDLSPSCHPSENTRIYCSISRVMNPTIQNPQLINCTAGSTAKLNNLWPAHTVAALEQSQFT